jgi:hypothetical protein
MSNTDNVSIYKPKLSMQQLPTYPHAVRFEMSKMRPVAMVIGSTLFVFLGIAFIVLGIVNFGQSDGSLKMIVIGIIAVAAFGFAAVFWGRSIAAKNKSLLIDANGITESDLSAVSVGFVPWQLFIQAEVKDALRPMIGLRFTQGKEILGRFSGMKQTMAKTYYQSETDQYVALIDAKNIRVKSKELAEFINLYFFQRNAAMQEYGK